MNYRNRSILQKIDPELISPMRAMSTDKVTVVLYSHGGCHGKCREKLENMGVKVKHDLPLIEGYSIEVSYDKLMDLASINDVKYISEDISVKTQMNIASQVVKSNIVNQSGYTGKGLGIAFIDTGIYPHGDFIYPQSRIVAFKDYVNGKSLPYDDNGHGTHCAGISAGNGNSSKGKYVGVAPDANIIALKAMDKQGGGNSSNILAAMQWVADNHKDLNIKVVSLSLGSQAGKTASKDPLMRGAEALWDKGITVVAAAGNSGPAARTIASPGASSKIITVGASDDNRTVPTSDDKIAEFSSRGPVGRSYKPDVVAPGVSIMSTKTDVDYQSGTKIKTMTNPYTTMSGTSMATPIVAGAAILMLQKHPDWTPNRVKESLMNNAVAITKNVNSEGRGLIDISKSIK